jgi:hypothetical protein
MTEKEIKAYLEKVEMTKAERHLISVELNDDIMIDVYVDRELSSRISYGDLKEMIIRELEGGNRND